MSPLELTTEPTPRLQAHVGGLADALDSERRLLDDLARVLVAQRDGVSQDDLEALDESVFSAHRILRTLQQARERRRTLLQLLGAPADLQPADLESALGSTMTAELEEARDELVLAAQALARELTMNRRVLDGAMAVGDRLLQIFSGVEEGGGEVYAPDAERRKAGSAGALLNTRV